MRESKSGSRVTAALLAWAAGLAVFGCDGSDEPAGDPVPAPDVASVRDEPPGEQCPFGGVAIAVGPDANGNGQLDDGEVREVEYRCHDESPVLVREDDAGDQCEHGGRVIHTGRDRDRDGRLADNDQNARIALAAKEWREWLNRPGVELGDWDGHQDVDVLDEILAGRGPEHLPPERCDCHGKPMTNGKCPKCGVHG